MSLGIDFEFLDKEGKVEGNIRRVGATINYDKLCDLNSFKVSLSLHF